MDYSSARTYIDKMETNGIVMGLSSILMLLEKIGNPQDELKFIHIAGTNGKGSVLASLSTILTKAKYKVGRYVSPTVYSYRERIQINGKYIDKEDFAKDMAVLATAIEQMRDEGQALPSPFEIETALAFLYFREKQCDIVVLECGMGGQLDATNVIRNTVLAVFTPVSMDHMSYLGNTLKAIASNKAGIIKPGAIAVSSGQEPEVLEAIQAACLKNGSPLIVAKPSEVVIRESNIDKQTFRYHGEEITIKLAGVHQIENAVTVLECVKALNHLGYDVRKEEVQEGFLATNWPGRFSVLRNEPTFIVDGAHNLDAAMRLKQSLRMYFPDSQFVFIMGMFKDKPYEQIAEMMVPMAKEVFTIETPNNPRVLKAKDLATVVAEYNDNVTVAKSIKDAVKQSMKAADNKDVIVAFGSLSFIGEITKIMTGEKDD